MPSTLEETRKTASTRTRKASTTRTRRTSTTRTRRTTTTRRRTATTTRKTRATTKTKARRKRRRIRRRMAMGAAAAAAATAIDPPLLLRMCMHLPNNQVFHVWGVKRACSSPVSFSLRPIFTFKKKKASFTAQPKTQKIVFICLLLASCKMFL